MEIYQDPNASIDDRVKDLLGKMTLEEKIGQMTQQPTFDTPRDLPTAKKEMIGSTLCATGEELLPVMKAAKEESRLGIPLLVGIDAIHGHSMHAGATMFPSQLALACAWDEDLCRDVARATAEEMNCTGCHWTFSPVLCMARDARWGRVNETFGEDKLLIGKLGAAMIRGYQGDDLANPENVAACAKHFCGYGETMGGREASESPHTERRMRAVFLPPFQEAEKAGVASYMTAYQAIDGIPCTANKWLLKTVLRDEWHSDALVVTDWMNVVRLYSEQFVAENGKDAAAIAANAGNELMMTPGNWFADAKEMVESGKIPMEVIDSAVARILKLKFKLGLFENPRYPDAEKAKKVIGSPAHRALALKAAEDSAVLLKNEGKILPLRREGLKKIAVIGANADDDLQQLGDWSAGSGQNQGPRAKHPRSCTCTLLDGMREEFGDTAEILYTRGCNGVDDTQNEFARAARLAAEADVVVLQLGDNLRFIGECCSVATLELQGGQKELFDAVAATGTPVIVVFMASKPLILADIVDRCRAIICSFNPGMEGGRALARIIAGKAVPGGVLPITFPRHVGQLPVYYNQTTGAHHRDYADMPGKGFFGLFPFGYGLSYSSFKLFNPRLTQEEYKCGEDVEVRFTVRNMGEVASPATAKVFARDVVSSVMQPQKNLVAWKKVFLQPGEEYDFAIRIPAERFTLVNADNQTVLEPGAFELFIECQDCWNHTLKFRYV